jgi:hypothetical protein
MITAITGSQVLVAVIQGKFSKKKTEADAAQILLDKTLVWASALTVRIEKLEAEIASCRQDKEVLMTRLATIEARLPR